MAVPSTLQELSNQPFLVISISLTILFIFIYLLYNLTISTDIPVIPNLPRIPNALPIFGHLLQLGDDHATVCEKWWRQYGHSIFQIRLGNTRAVVVNSFVDVKRMLVGHQSAVIDRPTLYTFHGVISSTKGFTIGSSPWDPSTRNRRQAAGKALGRASMKGYNEMFDLESFCIVRDLCRDSFSSSSSSAQQKSESKSESHEINIRPYFQRYALNTTLTLCYGIRMDNVYDDLLREILEVGSAISLLRSASENYQDYIPIMRWWPNNEKNRKSKELRERRDKYLDFLLEKVRGMIDRGTDRPCIASAIIRDEETKLSNVEVSSICLSLVSGGFETIPGTLTSCIGSLTSDVGGDPKGGLEWQDKAYEDIMRCYDGDVELAWEKSFVEEKVPIVNAIVREAARYYTVSAMSLPRKTVSEIRWKMEDGSEAVIPPKTMVLINAQAANHDVDYFGGDAGRFDPGRWLVDGQDGEMVLPPQEKSLEGIQHFSFGAGSRACSGQLIANRLLYTALVRLLTCYKILHSDDVNARANTDYVDYNAIKTALVAIPRDFRVKLVKRENVDVQALMDKWSARTAGFYVEE